MNYLTIENASKSYGDKILLDDVSLVINKGDKIALIARNGSGKTTFLNIIAGEESGEGENCNILFRKGIKTGYLHQDPVFRQDLSVIETIYQSDNPIIKAIHDYKLTMETQNEKELHAAVEKMDDLKAWDFESKIYEMLHRFNLYDDSQPVALMSGGQKKRLAMAKLLIDEPELIIMDEPTNHLDIEMIEWLEKYLQGSNITLFLVTHDRYFLDRICTQILELEGGHLFKYSGGYADYLEKKALKDENTAVNLEKDKKLLKKELNWVKRQPKARTTKAKSRVSAYENLNDKLSEVRTTKSMSIDIKSQRLGSKIIEIYDIFKSYDDLKIVEEFSYKFKKGEKVGIVGKNGVGKTTFLRMITGEERQDRGKIIIGDTVVFAHYTQDGMDLDESKTVLDIVRDIADYIPVDKGHSITAEQMLERFLFPRPQQLVKVHKLSGGEQRRLYLLTVLMKNPNFLILDEPTNDLDILTINVLEEYLQDFGGCVVVVSHDRFFMDKIVDHLFVFEGEGKIKDYNHTYSQYREEQKIKDLEKKKAETGTSDKTKTDNKISFELKKDIKRIEQAIDKLEKKKTEISSKFENPDLSIDKMTELSKELNEIKAKIEDKEIEWMELTDKL